MFALLALVLSQASPVPDVDGPIFSNPATMGGASLAFFEFAPASGAGMGEACPNPNWLPYSEQLTGAGWSNTRSGTPSPDFPTVTINQIESPTGTLTADRVDIPVTSGTGKTWRWFYTASIAMANTGWLGSCYVRGNTADGGSGSGTMDLGIAYNSSTGLTSSACNYTSSWTRCTTPVLTTPSGGGGVEIYIGHGTARAAQTVYVWGCQIERTFSTTPGTYVATAGSVALGAVPTGAKGEALTFTRASKSYCTKTGTGGLATSGIANGDLVYMPDNAPRVEYDADAFRGLLVEGARTNSVLRSQELDNASWASNNSVIALPTVTANAATAPDGTVTAERLQIPGSSTAGQYSQIYQLSACPAGTQVGSFYIKGVSGAGSVCWKIGTAVENCSYVSESWTRCTPSINAASSLTVALAVDVSACGANAGGVDAYVWGVQCENGAYATSYIPTTSGTATRAAESAYLTTSVAGPAYSSAGNFQTPYNVTSSSSRVVTLYQDGSHFADDYFSSNFQAFIYDGATDSKTSTTAVTTSGRVGSYFDATSLGVCVNASCESVAATVSYTAWTRVRLGIDGSGGTTGHINGIVSQVCVDPSPTKCR